MGISHFHQIESLFSEVHVKTLYVKFLSKKQDNDKNQIYLGKGLDGIINLFPSSLSLRSASTSSQKSKSKTGKFKIEAKLNFNWIQSEGVVSHAPNTRIIDYFQYPEVRLSSFLRGCHNPPDALRRTKQQLYGQRILILGANNQGETFGLILTEFTDEIVQNFPKLVLFNKNKILHVHVIGSKLGVCPQSLLLNELKEITGKWHPSITLKPKQVISTPFKGNQGAGFTLEALLNVPRNSLKEPDKYGYEIKTFKRNGKISLMTPTADTGEESRLSFRDFMGTYGWLGKKGDGRIVFNGIHKYRKICKTSKCVLCIKGYDDNTNSFVDDTEEIIVCLNHESNDIMIAGWSFNKLLEGWNKKHSSACYVEYTKKRYVGLDNQHDWEYFYTGNVFMSEGTTIFNYLRAIILEIVYYDAGHEISADGSLHQRPQWRISVTKNFMNTLKSLYNDVQSFKLIQG